MLDALWRRLGIDTVMTRLLAGRKRDPRTERVLFALVANRALEPGSKLAAAEWVNCDAHIDGLAETCDDACYRAMDWLLEHAPDLEREVFWQVADPARPRGRPAVLRHHLHLLRDRRRPTRRPSATPAADRSPTTRPATHRGRHDRRPLGTTAPVDTADGVGFRTYGKSKDYRDDLPQVVIGHGRHQGRDPGAGVVLARATPPTPR